MNVLSSEYARKFKKDGKLCPGDYDFNGRLYPAMKERPRFGQVVNLIDRIDSGVPKNVFSESFTNHYFIHCNCLNDGLVAAVAICNMIYKKYTYDIGDYLVDLTTNRGTEPAVMNASVKILPPILGSNSLPPTLFEEVEEEEEEADNAGVFLYCDAIHDDIFTYDSAGIRVCFVIYAEDEIKSANEAMMNSLMPRPVSVRTPQQAAAQLHYTYINIPADKSDEIAGIIADQFVKNGYGCDDVKKQIRALSKHPLVTDEYQAVAAAKHILNNHIQHFSSVGNMLPYDFDDYIKAAPETRKREIKTHLVGLERELGIVKGAVNSLAFDIERRNKGLTSEVSGCNMIFSGQPGTAKTTTAREFAKILADRLIIPGIDNFRECRKSDIVGQYVGHTAKKVDDLFGELSSKGGGVIFFDEIYTLSEKNSTCYDTEAINCITQNMENYRSKIFCIFAGYENKMKEFVEANPGLSSRISTTVKFAPYDDDTLCCIFDSIVKTESFKIIGDYKDTVKDYFGRLRTLRGDNFGNGREARNLFENAKRYTANRIMPEKKITKQMLSVMTADDISKAVKEILESVITTENSKMNPIGF